MRVLIFATRRRGGSERGAHAPSRAQHVRLVQDSRPPAGGSPLAPSVSCSWRHLDAAESEKATVRRADWSRMDMCSIRFGTPAKKVCLGCAPCMGRSVAGYAPSAGLVAQSLAVPPTRRSRGNLHLQRVGRSKASLTAEAASQRSRAVGARKHAPWWPVFTAPDVKKGVPDSAMARWFITVA